MNNAQSSGTLRNTIKRIPMLVMLYSKVRSTANSVFGLPRFLRDWLTFSRLNQKDHRFKWAASELYPCISDATESTGFDRHYTFHTAWAARVLAETRPAVHHDIGSAIYFSTIVSAFLPVRFYDVRPARLTLSNLVSDEANLTQLPFASNSIESLSCMHVVAHVGLGRYGDTVDPQGDLKAIAELKRVVKPGGTLLFVVPLGAQGRIQFNAHRIYTAEMVQSYFKDGFDLSSWALISDNPADGDLLVNPPADVVNRQSYGCGCFWFRKR
jgi:SAM-dependent methyltransferase